MSAMRKDVGFGAFTSAPSFLSASTAPYCPAFFAQ
jgi:hypothetical protein